ncbi:MAG: hypothetical protein ACRDRH_30210 [Pseudonocardia sp.]
MRRRPEFSNPLFLKLTCEALSTLGEARFRFGSAGITTVGEAFLHPGAWPIPARSVEEIEAMAGEPDYAYGSTWYSLTGMRDFGRHILKPALDHIVTDDEQTMAREVEVGRR